MPRLFVPSEELAGASVTLVGEPHRYLTRVLRFGAGTRVHLFDGLGMEVEATILRAGSREVTLQLGARRFVPKPPTPAVTLLQGLARPERMDVIVQKATELGATRIIPVRAARSASGQQARADRWQKIAREAARQSGRADCLVVAPLTALGDALAGLAAGTKRVVPWEDAPGAKALGQALPAASVIGVDLLIGPEGGMTADEVHLAEDAGFEVVTLGPRILRTETAAIAALAVIQNHLGGLGETRVEARGDDAGGGSAAAPGRIQADRG